METFIRKQLGMKAHWVTRLEETTEGIVAWLERLGQRRLHCGDCRPGLKEEFLAFWHYVRTRWAPRHLQHRLWWASHSRLPAFTKFAKLVRAHLPGILAWTRVRVTNGVLERMNSKIKLVSHRAYGYRNPQNFIAAIYHCCAKLPLPA